MKMKKNQLPNFIYPIFGVFGLSLVILVHELGHFIAAKFFGVAATVFSIGFGPTLLATQIGETTFRIAAIPFGGYVSLVPADLIAQPYLAKFIIMTAGILCNLIFAYAIFVFLALRSNYRPVPVIKKVFENSPASHAHLQEEDQFIALDGKKITPENLTYVTEYIISSPGKKIEITVDRNGSKHTIPITLSSQHPIHGNNIGWLGIEWKQIHYTKPTLWQALTNTKSLIKSMAKDIKQLMPDSSKTENKSGFIGPIGIIMLTGKSLAVSPYYFLLILAIVSFNVGIFNLLPLPLLDGGKLLQFTIEAIIGPLPPYAMLIVTSLFFLLFLYFLMRISVGDIKRLRKR